MKDREILVGVTGGVAAFKTAALVSQLVQQDARVTVVMTESARHFVGADTFAALTGRPVVTRVFAPNRYPLGAHIELTQRAELLCVAPATANFLASAAHGSADDLLSTAYLCFTGPVLVAPAMNCAMWDNAAVVRNVQQLRDDGVTILEPEEGWLSCRQRGAGRMASPEVILQAIEEALK